MTPTTTYSRPTEAKTTNREAWLMQAAEHLWGRVIEAGGERPKTFRVSCGWPSKSALRTASSRSRRIGEAWHSSASEDEAREVFISPALADEVVVMDVLLHELIHAALPADAGHGPAFQAIMRKVGLAGKPTSTYASDDLVAELRVIAHELGRYPHEKLDAPLRAGKPGRMVKGFCPECENILYGSRAAWDAALPVCGPCGATYVVDPSDAQAAAWGLKPAEHAERLENVATTVELKTKDGRFSLRSTKVGGREGKWTVTDHEAVESRRRTVETTTIDGEEVTTEVVEYDARLTIRHSREDALAFIAAIRSGELGWDAVEVDEVDEVEELDEDELDDLLGPVGEWDALDDEFLADDEDEDPDNDDGHLPEDPEELAAFLAEEAKRDLAGLRKSERIAKGAEEAMD